MKRGPKPKPSELKTPFKNIAIDAELVDFVNQAADELQKVFGFRPTLSQTLKHLLKKVNP